MLLWRDLCNLLEMVYNLDVSWPMNTNAGMLVQPHVNIDLAAYFSEGDQAMYIFLAV